MTQEERQLLLVDLCARLPYGVICKSKSYRNILFNSSHISLIESEEIKPYLRPLSSMTEEEYEELLERVPKHWIIDIGKLGDLYFDIGDASYPDIDLFVDIIDWLLKNHFDFRGLIEKGLAIAVTEENNPYKE